MVIMLLLPAVSVFSQQKVVRLKDGDMVPDIEFPLIINSSLKHAKLSDFRGKFVILDYWALWCGSCLEKMPELARLQQKYKDQVVILPVSFLHKKEAIQQFVNKRKGTHDEIKLPLAIFENINNQLYNLLPAYAGYPNLVFIDKKGKLVQTSISVDKVILDRLLKGEKTGALSNDYQTNFNINAPLLVKGNGGNDTSFLYKSMITGYLDSLKSYKQEIQFNGSRSRLLYINMPVLELAKAALRRGISEDPFNHFVVFEGVEPSKFIFTRNSELERQLWMSKNFCCYELTLPSSFNIGSAYDIMHNDIDRYFRFSSSLEKRILPCYTLTRIDTIDRLKSKANKASSLRSEDKLSVKYQKVNIETLIGFIADRPEDPIVIDETSYKGRIDIAISIDKKFNLEMLNSQLESYGLKLDAAKKEFDVVVIKSRGD